MGARFALQAVLIWGLVHDVPLLQAAQDRPLPDEGKETCAAGPAPDALDKDVAALRSAWRDGLSEVSVFLVFGGTLILSLLFIVCLILVYTPHEIPSAKPFNPAVERKRRRDDNPDWDGKYTQ